MTSSKHVIKRRAEQKECYKCGVHNVNPLLGFEILLEYQKFMEDTERVQPSLCSGSRTVKLLVALASLCQPLPQRADDNCI
jgi:hypothetical protein